MHALPSDYRLAEHLLEEDVADAIDRTWVRIGLGYTEPLTLFRLPATEDVDRLIQDRSQS